MESLSVVERAAYYRGALACLKFVEKRRPTGRRFGKDADAAWKSLRGDLTAADRIDLLFRDADAEWPAAFGATAVFNLEGTAEDEAFRGGVGAAGSGACGGTVAGGGAGGGASGAGCGRAGDREGVGD